MDRPAFQIVAVDPADAPLDLLLLADPERSALDAYIPQSDLFAARDEAGRTLGVLALHPGRAFAANANANANETGGLVEIKNIAVDEAWQGRGIGRRLLSFALEEARARGCGAIEIGTGNSSLDQLALYQKVGFRMNRIDRDFFIRNYDEAIFENGIQCRDMVLLRMDL